MELLEFDELAGDEAEVLGVEIDRHLELVYEACRPFYHQHADQSQRIEKPGV